MSPVAVRIDNEIPEKRRRQLPKVDKIRAADHPDADLSCLRRTAVVLIEVTVFIFSSDRLAQTENTNRYIKPE